MRVHSLRRLVGHGPLVRYLEEAEGSQWKSPEELRRLQWRKFMVLLKHAVENVPYYRSLFREAGLDVGSLRGPEDLSRIPILTKEVLQAKKNELLSERVDRDSLREILTSGSTSTAVAVFVDRDCHLHQQADTIRFNRWACMDWRSRVGSMWTKPLRPKRFRFTGDRYEERPISWVHRQARRAADFLVGQNPEVYCCPFGYQLADLERFARDLVRLRPDVLYGYPNVLGFFAEFVRDNRIRGIEPRAVLCCGEVVTDALRRTLSDVFGARVHSRYGTNEVGSIACECERGRMHVNDESVLLEVVPQAGIPLGSVVVTPLNNFAMPLIRYEIADLAELSEDYCECGRGLSLISKLEGRKAEVLKTGDGRYVMSSWMKYRMYEAPSVERYQVRQVDYHRFVITVVPRDGSYRKELEGVSDRIRGVFGQETAVEIEAVEEIPHHRSGKYHYIACDIP